MIGRALVTAAMMLFAVAGDAGCSIRQTSAREFNVTLNGSPAPVGPLVVMVELVRRSRPNVDCPPQEDRDVTTIAIIEGRDGRFTTSVPATTSTSFGMGYNAQEIRWTIYAPGYAILTIFPAGDPYGQLTPSGTFQPTIGWRYPLAGSFAPMDSVGPLVGAPIAVGARSVELAIWVRSLDAGRGVPAVDSAAFTHRRSTVPIALCPTDAANLQEQLDALLSALERDDWSVRSAAMRRLILDGVARQIESLSGYKLVDATGGDLAARFALVRRKLDGESPRVVTGH
jgi:hypothetical protein